jgi:hypothetical protein
MNDNVKPIENGPKHIEEIKIGEYADKNQEEDSPLIENQNSNHDKDDIIAVKDESKINS